MTDKNFVKDPFYENPPVTEVICGIFFTPIKGLLTPYQGLLWERFKPDFTICQEVTPFIPTIESFEETLSPFRGIEFVDPPPPPRVWFINTDKTRVIQLQRDSFLYNWRKVRAEDEYPRYKNVVKCFGDHLADFLTFVKEMKFGDISPIQYELTYINHIPQGQGWESLSGLGEVFPDFYWRKNKQRFLPTPEKLNWRTSFVLPNQIGRLHVSIQTGLKGEEKIPNIFLEMKTRGIGPYSSIEEMRSWFDIAHHWIVHGFGDLTGKDIQKTIWRRK